MSSSATASTRAADAGRLRARGPASALVAPALLLGLALVVPRDASAQSMAPTSMPDPRLCRIVLEDMGDVGLRISDAQVLADAAVTSFKKRLGNDAATYEGIVKSLERMRKMLGKGAEATPQDAQIAYYRACIEAAPYRAAVKFGVSGKKKGAGRHWATATCRKAGAEKTDVLDELKVEAATFPALRDAFVEKLPSFCGVVAPPPPTAQQGAGQATPSDQAPAWLSRKKPSADWKPPPSRD